MSTAYELQIYQNGQWQFDSYFDDRDTVVSEAERMISTGRYSGVRVLEESYKPNSNTCEYHVIFSRLGKDMTPGGNWRDQYSAGRPTSRAAEAVEHVRRARSRNGTGPRTGPSSSRKTNPVLLVLLGTVLVLGGIAAVIVLRSYAAIS